MDGSESRQIARDSLFVMADLRADGADQHYRIKVRNLSPAGMMGEGTVRVSRGDRVQVNIRNSGWTEGTIAWVQENRFGVAFHDEIDPRVARTAVGEAPGGATLVAPPRMPGRSGGAVRKV